ncbi:MAG: thiamine pyrophosphate-binding protein, partial [Nitrososphaeria archaeon]
MKGAEFVAKMLKYNGVEFVSTLCGNGLHLLYPELVREGIRLIDVRHEQAAAYIADSYARLTGKLGVCIVSSGVAHAMALSGLVNSYFDCAPVLLITGASSGYGSGKGVFQEFDQEGLASKICKYSDAVSSGDELAYKLERAISFAFSGTRGPVHLTIPENILREEVNNIGFKNVVEDSFLNLGQVKDTTVNKIVGLLDKATKPLLIVGGSLFYWGTDAAKEIVEFSRAFSIPMVVPIWDHGVIDEEYYGFIGVIGAASGGPKVLDEADLIILVGARVDYRIGFLASPNVRKDVKIIRVDVDPVQVFQGIKPDLPVVAEPASVFKKVREESLKQSVQAKSEWLIEARKRFNSFREKIESVPDKVDGKLTGKGLVKAIKPFTEDSIFLIDGGNIGQWAHMLANKYPRNWLTCGASGVVGWGLSGAIGAKLAFPEKRVLLLSGDGAFGFNIGELDTAIKHGIQFVAVVA